MADRRRPDTTPAEPAAESGEDARTAHLQDPPSSYREAEDELEAILTAIEDEDVDVDELSAKVARARELITWCRQRLAQAELQVTELLADPEDA